MKKKALLTVIIIFTIFISNCSKINTKTHESKNFNGDSFTNIYSFELKTFFDFLIWQIERNVSAWPTELKNSNYNNNFKKIINDNEIEITFINQSSFLIRTSKGNFLLDPVYSDDISPFFILGAKRSRPPGVELNKLPKIDWVFVSHNHLDHMDLSTLKFIYNRDKSKFILPLNNGHYLEEEGIKNITELDWWESVDVNNLKLTLLPAQHWSQRTLFDQNRALWGGLSVAGPFGKLFFSGDTGYEKHFKEIYEKIGGFSICLLSIGSYSPREFMRFSHMNPADAIMAHHDLNCKQSIGMHFGTFQETDEAYDDPIKELEQEKKNQHNNINFTTLDFGESKLFIK